MALVAALGGFLFGFDTIVINGAEQDIQRRWSLSGTVHGWVVSSALWGTVAGALVGGWIADRFFGGVGVGVSTIVAPVYIAEIAPSESRGKMMAAFQALLLTNNREEPR